MRVERHQGAVHRGPDFEVFGEEGFRPDIALDDVGVWRWNSDKPAMHAYVRDYFAARKEDG